MPRFSIRRRHLLPALLLLVCGAILASVLVSRLTTQPEWKRQLASLREFEVNPAGRIPLKFQNDCARLRNEIEKMDLWSEPQADELIAWVRRVPLDAPPITDDMEPEDAEARFFAATVLVSIAERLRIGAPIDPQARQSLSELLYERSFATDPSVRHTLANLLCSSNLILEDKKIHDRVVALIDDPDPEVAMNARRHYTWHTSTPEAKAKLQELGVTGPD